MVGTFSSLSSLGIEKVASGEEAVALPLKVYKSTRGRGTQYERRISTMWLISVQQWLRTRTKASTQSKQVLSGLPIWSANLVIKCWKKITRRVYLYFVECCVVLASRARQVTRELGGWIRNLLARTFFRRLLLGWLKRDPLIYEKRRHGAHAHQKFEASASRIRRCLHPLQIRISFSLTRLRSYAG